VQAVILAAGSGKRLEKVSGGKPKCLLTVGGKTIIEHQIEMLHDAGIGKILVVVGYKADEVKAALGHRVEYVENTIYDETNSLYSLWLASDWIEGPFVLLNCDLLFHPEILYRLLGKGGCGLAYDSTSTKGNEQTKVAVHSGMVVDLGKDLSPTMSHGESMGLLSFDDDGAKILLSRVNALIDGGGENSWVIEGVRAAASNIGLKGYNFAGMPWVEIDFPNDYERAEREIWPAIKREHWKMKLHWRTTKYLLVAVLLVAAILIGLNVGSRSTPDKVVWINEAPTGGEKVTIKLAKGQQKWWASSKGKPLSVEVEGPIELRVDYRLVLAPGATEPGRYVVEVKLDGEPHTWMTFKSTPHPEVIFPDGVIGDRDRVSIDVPEGRHSISVGLLAGTSEKFLTRIRYPEPLANDDGAEQGQE
jgi:choline kinase